MLFLFALCPGMLAASLADALLYFSGSMTTPGVFKILGRIRFLTHTQKRSLSFSYPQDHHPPTDHNTRPDRPTQNGRHITCSPAAVNQEQ